MQHQPHLTIRDAIETDVPAILKMHAQSWLDTYPNEAAGVSREWVQTRVGLWSEAEKIEGRRARIRKSQNNPDYLYRIAENEQGEVVGFVAPFRDEGIQRVGAIYVDKAYHGTGLAGRLMKQIIGWADPRQPLELEVVTYNERAKAFYRKYGFKEVPNSEHIVHDMLPVITMSRQGESDEV